MTYYNKDWEKDMDNFLTCEQSATSKKKSHFGPKIAPQNSCFLYMKSPSGHISNPADSLIHVVSHRLYFGSVFTLPGSLCLYHCLSAEGRGAAPQPLGKEAAVLTVASVGRLSLCIACFAA